MKEHDWRMILVRGEATEIGVCWSCGIVKTDVTEKTQCSRESLEEEVRRLKAELEDAYKTNDETVGILNQAQTRELAAERECERLRAEDKMHQEVLGDKINELIDGKRALQDENEKLRAEVERLSDSAIQKFDREDAITDERDELRAALAVASEALRNIARIDNDRDRARPYWEELAGYRRKLAEQALAALGVA